MRKTTEPLIFELSTPGRMGATLPRPDVPPSELPPGLLREDLPLPEVSEVDAVRHYTRLSQMNYAVDVGFYPLGSCTMKYNPKVNEAAARLPGFVRTHPYQSAETVQGNLQLMYELQEALKELCGFAGVSLQPAAGAHGEFAGILMMRAYHEAHGEVQRRKILIPDSAHGTNPASSAMSGYTVVEVPSDKRGNVDLAALRRQCGGDVVGLMLTNPNTLGLFEEHVLEVVELIHGCGGLMYGDGANLNALLGVVRPGDLGVDVMHFNLHKTFSTPHGGGGPGAGPVGASQKLAPYLPGPIAVRTDEGYGLAMPERSVGRVKAFYGNFSVFVRAYTYISMLGEAGLREVAGAAVLNANYLRMKLQHVYRLPYDRTCMHEFVLSGRLEGAPEVHAVDIAKRLIDYGFYPPTIYFPLIVPEALMIEPTETESPDMLDSFAEALLAIAREARSDPQLLHEAPHRAPVTRLDEVRAARHPDLNWKPESTE
jgi:glycine dehydrogenase subunit 2